MKHGKDIKPTMRESGTAVLDLRIELFPSGKVKINGAPQFRGDAQAIARLAILFDEARKAQVRATKS